MALAPTSQGPARGDQASLCLQRGCDHQVESLRTSLQSRARTFSLLLRGHCENHKTSAARARRRSCSSRALSVASAQGQTRAETAHHQWSGRLQIARFRAPRVTCSCWWSCSLRGDTQRFICHVLQWKLRTEVLEERAQSACSLAARMIVKLRDLLLVFHIRALHLHPRVRLLCAATSSCC